MHSSEDRIRGWVENVVDRTRDRLHQDLTNLVSNLARAMADELAVRQAEAAAAARREAEAAGAALASEAITAERRAAEERLTQAVAAVRAELEAEREQAVARVRAEQSASAPAGVVSGAAAAERDGSLPDASSLLDAVRALDSASSLTQVLDALASQARRFTARAAVLVYRDRKLYGWAWHGFPEDAGVARDYTADAREAGISGVAALSGEPATSGNSDRRGVLSPSRPDRAALGVPLKAGGDVVAVLYADNDGEPSGAAGGPPAPPVVPSAWPEIVETLARHAERCLETVIVRSLPELLRAGAVERARRRTLRYDDEAAERYARLLVAEIKLYHEALVDEARRERNLLRRLRPQIERAQQLYDERVAPAVRGRTSYFEQELVRTLAGGDPSLLGQPT